MRRLFALLPGRQSSSAGPRLWSLVGVLAAVAAPALASPASDAAYETGRRYVEARDYRTALPLLDRAAAADPDSPSGHRSRLLQLLVLNAHVGRCLSALSCYDRGLQDGTGGSRAALRRQREQVAAEGYAALRQLLRASQGYRQHLPPRADCVLEISPPEPWNLAILNAAESRIETGQPLTVSERANYERHMLRVWLTMTLSQLYSRPGRDDREVMRQVSEVLRAGERVDPWIVLAATVDTLAAVVSRSLLDEEIGRARVVHKEMHSAVAALLLNAPESEGIIARTRAEASVKQVFGPERGEEWFRELEFATRLVKARQ
jgi:hypothetical protein